MLGSLPLLSFRIERTEPSDNVTRKFAFKVSNICVEEQLGALCVTVFCPWDQMVTKNTLCFCIGRFSDSSPHLQPKPVIQPIVLQCCCYEYSDKHRV